MGALICDLCRRQMKIYSRRGNIFQSVGVTFEARKIETRRRIDSCWAAEWQTLRSDWRPGRRSADCKTIIPARSHPLFCYFPSLCWSTHNANKHTHIYLSLCVYANTRLVDWLEYQRGALNVNPDLLSSRLQIFTHLGSNQSRGKQILLCETRQKI